MDIKKITIEFKDGTVREVENVFDYATWSEEDIKDWLYENAPRELDDSEYIEFRDLVIEQAGKVEVIWDYEGFSDECYDCYQCLFGDMHI